MRFMPSRRAGAALLVTAVAGGSLAAAASAATTLRINTKREGVAFTKKNVTAAAGRVTIITRVPRGSEFPHAIAIRGRGVNRQGRVVQGGGTSRVSANLRRGRYTFYCPVGEHAANGMRGTLRVN
jgi:plastocyanin